MQDTQKAALYIVWDKQDPSFFMLVFVFVFASYCYI